MKVRVFVRLKPGVLDVQGKAVEQGLGDPAVRDVRVGRLIELDVDAPDFESAREKVAGLCELVLANPVIERYEIQAG